MCLGRSDAGPSLISVQIIRKRLQESRFSPRLWNERLSVDAVGGLEPGGHAHRFEWNRDLRDVGQQDDPAKVNALPQFSACGIAFAFANYRSAGEIPLIA
jgi:hypothetical protein